MNDILIYESGNGGDLRLKDNGDIDTTDGIFNQPYLSHFGGNTEAITTGNEIDGDERFDWWGNTFFETEAQMNSLLEKSLNENTLSSSGRNNIQKDSLLDLQSLNALGSINSIVSIIGTDKIKISDKINQVKKDFIWTKTNDELIEEITI